MNTAIGQAMQSLQESRSSGMLPMLSLWLGSFLTLGALLFFLVSGLLSQFQWFGLN